MHSNRIPKRIRPILTWYKSCALMSFNVIVVFVALNLLLGGVTKIRDLIAQDSNSSDDPITARYGDDVLNSVYPDLERRERELMLSETWKYPLEYSDFNHFRARPFVGRYVNVTSAGYRKSFNQGPWPPSPQNINVFVFGGSTTFGCGVPDEQTVPSFLQQAFAVHTRRRVCVYNFGVGFYYSTQERICLEKLLMDGYVPHITVFIDGINEGTHSDNRPTYSREMHHVFEQALSSRGSAADKSADWRRPASDLLSQLPIGRAARYVNGRSRTVESSDHDEEKWKGRESSERICDTYFTNKFLIEQLCHRFGVTPLFVWQPSPAYKYDLKYHLFAPASSDAPRKKYHFEIMRDYYPVMRDFQLQRGEDNFLWCADLQQDRTECLYCDRYHYTAAFSKDLASYIGQLCLARKLLAEHLEL